MNRDENSDYTQHLRALIDAGVDLNAVDDHGLAPLHHAIMRRDLSAVKLLKTINADFTVLTKNGQNAFFWLSYKFTEFKVFDDDQDELFNLLLQGGCEIYARDKFGQTPIHWAAENNDIDVINNLLSYGADINSQEYDGKNTALHIAINREYFHLVEFLLNNDADVNIKDSYGASPLHLAVKQKNLKIIILLLNSGAEIDSKDSWNSTPLHVAVKQETIEIIELLLDHGANVNSKDSCGNRPLHWAVLIKGHDILKMLLSRGAIVNAQNYKKETAICRAIRLNNIDCMQILFKLGAEINDAGIISLLKDYSKLYERKVLFEHWIKLKVAKLPYSKEYETFVKLEEYRQLYESCQREIEIMKQTSVDSYTSLYRWLHMDSNGRCLHIKNQRLCNIVDSPMIEEQFPEYATVIIGVHFETVVKKSLLVPAKQAWLKLTGIELPDICLEQIFVYLNTGDMISFIEMDDLKNDRDKENNKIKTFEMDDKPTAGDKLKNYAEKI